MLSIGSFMAHDSVFFDWYDSDPEKGKNVTSVYGSIPCKLQSGRCMNHLIGMSVDDLINVVKKYNQRGIAVYLTFSRHDLSADDMEDARSNEILEGLNALQAYVRNGVIISNDLLLKHVRENYGNLICISSILKPTYESDSWVNDDPEYYNILCERYDYVVVNPARIVEKKFRDRLEQKNKIVILKNSRCRKNCPMAMNHYSTQNAVDDAILSGKSGAAEREQMSLITRKCSDTWNTADSQYISDDMMLQIYSEGFKNWKLDGREYSDEQFLTELIDCIELLKRR